MREIPTGYHIEEHKFWGECLISDDQREFFRLTDRKFSDGIDHYLGYLPSRFLGYMLSGSGGPLTVLDAGGGRKSTAAAEIAQTYGEQVKVINIDIMPPARPNPGNVKYIQGDICSMDIPDNSVDLALSYEVLTHFDGIGKQERAIAEIARVLKPGRPGLVNDTYFTRMNLLDRRISQFISEHGAFITTRRGNLSEKGMVVLGSPHSFTMVVKEPIDQKLFTIRETIIGHC